MLGLRLPNQSPNLSKLFSFAQCSAPVTSRLVSVSCAMASSVKVVAEYAKSNRSACKHCGKTIPSGSLRLGLSSRDRRGFDMTKWHHLDCFPKKREVFGSAKEINGFSSLKSSDQEALKKLEEESSNQTPQKDSNAEKDGDEKIERSLKVRKADAVETNELKESNFKKPKMFGAGMGQEIALSVSDIKNKYKDATLLPEWKAFQTIIFREKDDGLHDSEKIAAFDFDGCLANTSVKRTGPDAWSLMYPSIPEKLQSLYSSGYKLVIFTNESNIERWNNKRQQAVDSKIGRLNNFIKLVKVPMQVFIACGLGKSKGETDDPFRKPNVGMWKIMCQHFNSGIPIDMDQSFYVGDAAGRVNDHSDADIRFAQAIGLKFYLPEDYFGV